MARGSRLHGGCALVEWEIDELLALHRGGWPDIALATFYGVTERTVRRYLRRERVRADSSHAGGKVE